MIFLYAYLVVGFLLAVAVIASETVLDACRENGPWVFRACFVLIFPWHALLTLFAHPKGFPSEMQKAFKALMQGHSV